MKWDVRIERVVWRLLTWLLALVMLLDLALAENSVHILSKYGRNQLVTSSTLRWVHGEYPQTVFPPNFVVGAHQYDQVESNEAAQEKRKGQAVYVCRARHNGIWLVGSLTSGRKCVVFLLGNVFPYEKYEVLQNVDEAARLSWVRWDRFSGVATGAVSTGERETYVARRRVLDKEEDTADNMPSLVPGVEAAALYLIGKLDTREGLGRIAFINQTGQEEHHVDGEILVEIEPVRYELTIRKFNERRKHVSRAPRTLGTAQLTNDVNQVSSTVDSVIAYEFNYSLYWGQGQGILTGHPTSIILPNGTLFEKIKWGIQETLPRKEVFKIEAILEPNTGVNVTLRGNYTDSSVPYTADLVSVYEDKVTRSRQFQGTRKEIAMLDVVPDYSPVYFLHNFSLVPTTTTTTTTTLPTTITTTTLATTEMSEATTRKPKKNETRRNENSAMLSDDGDALSLKKSEEASQTSPSKASVSNVSVYIFYLSLAVLCIKSVIL